MKKYLISLFLLLFSVNVFAANHYIRAGATGANNGSSWANAWTSFGAVTWTRSDTYYVAGGAYSGNVTISVGTPANGWITVKKANAPDNSGDAGWDASFGTTQAVVNGTMTANYGNVEINGVTGSGESGHGIKIYNSGTALTYVVKMDNTASAPYHFHNLEVKGAGVAGSVSQVGIYVNAGTNQKGLYISNCWIHDISLMGLTFGGYSGGGFIGTSYADYGMLLENNVISETGLVTNGDHGQGIQIGPYAVTAYLIIRNNTWRNIVGSGMIVYLGGNTNTESIIYNNIFYSTDNATYSTLSPAVIWVSGVSATTDKFYIYNNTFYGIGSLAYASVHGRIGIESSAAITDIQVKNNIWVSSYIASGGHYGPTVFSNNDYYLNVGTGVPTSETNQKTESADPFINWAGYDFRLKSTANARDNGVDLSSVFTTDIVGNTRPQGLAWDIGAYEYKESYSAPKPPANPRIVQ